MPRDPDTDPDLIRAKQRLEEAHKGLEAPPETTDEVIEEEQQEQVEVETPPEPPEEPKTEPPAVVKDDGVPEVATRQENLNEADELRRSLADRDAKIAELTRKLNTADGKFGSELDRLRKQNEETLARLRETTERLDKIQSEKDKPTPEQELAQYFEGVPKEVLDSYDEESLKMIVKVAESAAKRFTGSQGDTTAPLKQSLEQLERQNAYNQYVSAVEAMAPGFIAANGNPALNVEPNPEWLEFLNSPVNPDISPQTWHELATSARSPEVAAKVFRRWQEQKASEGQAPTEPAAKKGPSPSSQVAPKRSAATTTPPKPESERVFSRKDYEQLIREMSSPEGYTDERRALLHEYQKADLEGRMK